MSPRSKADLGKVLGHRQASILEYLWTHGPQSVADLHRGLAEADDLAYTTVYTELGRMLKKGLIVKNSGGGTHLDVRYRAAQSRDTVVSGIVTKTLGNLIAAHGSAAVHGFVDALADDETAMVELRRLLKSRERR